MHGGTPQGLSERDQFAWVAARMGGIQASLAVVRDDFRIRWFAGRKDVTTNVASFVRRGFMQINVSKNQIKLVFPGEEGWRND